MRLVASPGINLLRIVHFRPQTIHQRAAAEFGEGIHAPAIAFGRASGTRVTGGNALRFCDLVCRSWRRRQVLVKQLCFGSGATARAEAQDLQHQNPPLKSDGQHVADANGLAGAVNLVAVDPDMTSGGQLLRQRARLRDPGEPEPLVDPL